MRSQTLLILCVFSLWAVSAQAQFSEDSGSSPIFGGPGNYVYPVVCGECTVWQDYRNFAWNQLDINGGFARTPNNPGHVTAFRIYTHDTDDLVSVLVEITLEIVDVEVLGNDIGTRIVDPEHYWVETHPENGDAVSAAFYSKNQGPLLFPYEPLDDGNTGGSTGGGTSPGGGGGDSPSGGSNTPFGGGGSGAGGGGSGGGGSGAGGGGTYCGPGTEWICITL